MDVGVKFNIEGINIPALKRTDKWTYLGVPFSPEGRVDCDPSKIISAKLGLLTKAPLKPQQRVFALRVFILPSMIHLLTLGATYTGTLKKIDCLVRNAVKMWLKLPNDTPSAYFHANVVDGGWG